MFTSVFSNICLFVCLSACLSVRNSTQKLLTDFDEIYRIARQWHKKQSIKVCWWSRSPCWLFKWKSGHYSTIFEQILMICLEWYQKQLIQFLGWSGSPCWLSKSGIQAIWDNELPWPRSALLSAHFWGTSIWFWDWGCHDSHSVRWRLRLHNQHLVWRLACTVSSALEKIHCVFSNLLNVAPCCTLPLCSSSGVSKDDQRGNLQSPGWVSTPHGLEVRDLVFSYPQVEVYYSWC